VRGSSKGVSGSSGGARGSLIGGRRAILNAYTFARADEGQPGSLPHHWSVTSDSVAARVAVVTGAHELILLKSVTIPPTPDWRSAAREGWVDPYFTDVLLQAKTTLQVRSINFRARP
jgi:hypothetical protein